MEAINQLWEAMEESVEIQLIHKGFAKERDLQKLISQVKTHVCKLQSKISARLKFSKLQQRADEPASKWETRLQGEAEHCGFWVEGKCDDCDSKVTLSYKESEVLNQLLVGLHESDWRVKLLQMDDKAMTVEKIVKILSKFESGRETNDDIDNKGNIAKVSGHQQAKNAAKPNYKSEEKKPDAVKDKKPCKACGAMGHGPKKADRAANCKAYNAKCDRCGRLGHFTNLCLTKEANIGKANAMTEDTDDGEIGLFYMFSVDEIDEDSIEAKMLNSQGQFCRMTPMEHHEMINGKWTKTKLEEHGTVKVRMTPYIEGYEELMIDPLEFESEEDAVGDTGAMMCVAGTDIMENLGVNEEELIAVKMNIKVADNRKTKVRGAILTNLTGCNKRTKEKRGSSQVLYIMEGVKGLYLSKQCARDLGLVSPQFPTIADEKTGRHVNNSKWVDNSISTFNSNLKSKAQVKCNVNSVVKHDNQVVEMTTKLEPEEEDDRDSEMGTNVFAEIADRKSGDIETCEKMRKYCTKYKYEGPRYHCGCPVRQLPPEVPSSLPFEPTEENIVKMEEWIFKQYLSSSFNVCEQQPLPMISSSPPVKLIVEENAVPVACTKASSIPINWLEKIKEELDKDVRLGVIAPVPENIPVTWCSRMGIVPKKSGEPRRVIDFGL